MGFRDQRATLEERLRTSSEAVAETQRTLMDLDAALEARRDAIRQRRLWNGLRAVTFLVVTVTVGAIITTRHRSASAEQEKRDEVRRVLAEQHNSVVREIRDMQTRVERREQPSPARSSAAAELYDTIGRLHCDEERDAWMIVGAAACSIGVRSSREAAAQALSDSDEDELERLCRGVESP